MQAKICQYWQTFSTYNFSSVGGNCSISCMKRYMCGLSSPRLLSRICIVPFVDINNIAPHWVPNRQQLIAKSWLLTIYKCQKNMLLLSTFRDGKRASLLCKPIWSIYDSPYFPKVGPKKTAQSYRWHNNLNFNLFTSITFKKRCTIYQLLPKNK